MACYSSLFHLGLLVCVRISIIVNSSVSCFDNLYARGTRAAKLDLFGLLMLTAILRPTFIKVDVGMVRMSVVHPATSDHTKTKGGEIDNHVPSDM